MIYELKDEYIELYKLIKFLDKLSKMKTSGISKLPKISNTKGSYIKQYVDSSGTHCGEVTVYRINKNFVGIYFLDFATENCKNLNSRNRKCWPNDNDEMMFEIFKNRKHLRKDDEQIDIFINNVKKLAIRKENEGSYLEEIISKILGKEIRITVNDEAEAMRRYYSSAEVITKEDAKKALKILMNYINNGKQFNFFN